MRMPVSLAALYAARAALDTAIMAAEQEAGVGEPDTAPGSCPKCGAPPELQENRDNLAGQELRWCQNCREEWEP